MAIFDKFQQLAATRRALSESGIQAISVVMDQVVSATEAVVNGPDNSVWFTCDQKPKNSLPDHPLTT